MKQLLLLSLLCSSAAMFSMKEYIIIDDKGIIMDKILNNKRSKEFIRERLARVQISLEDSKSAFVFYTSELAKNVHLNEHEVLHQVQIIDDIVNSEIKEKSNRISDLKLQLIQVNLEKKQLIKDLLKKPKRRSSLWDVTLSDDVTFDFNNYEHKRKSSLTDIPFEIDNNKKNKK